MEKLGTKLRSVRQPRAQKIAAKYVRADSVAPRTNCRVRHVVKPAFQEFRSSRSTKNKDGRPCRTRIRSSRCFVNNVSGAIKRGQNSIVDSRDLEKLKRRKTRSRRRMFCPAREEEQNAPDNDDRNLQQRRVTKRRELREFARTGVRKAGAKSTGQPRNFAGLDTKRPEAGLQWEYAQNSTSKRAVRRRLNRLMRVPPLRHHSGRPPSTPDCPSKARWEIHVAPVANLPRVSNRSIIKRIVAPWQYEQTSLLRTDATFVSTPSTDKTSTAFRNAGGAILQGNLTRSATLSRRVLC